MSNPNNKEKIRFIENDNLKSTISQVKKSLKETKEKEKKLLEELKSIENQWSQVKIKASTYSGNVETAANVRQQQMLIRDRKTALESVRRSIDIYQRLIDSPYFSMIEIKDEHENQEEKIYIGISNFEDNNKFLVHDWRAPISSLFYEGKIGKNNFESPSGIRNIDLDLKRQFKIKNSELISVFNSDEAINDELLIESLSKSSDDKMSNIVSSIQKEQNVIIRNTYSPFLIINGRAGSGKTSIVMQRIAYLLYRYRYNVKTDQIIMFTPNKIFSDYIKEVLPQLGEQNIPQLTFKQYINTRLRSFDIETVEEKYNNQNNDYLFNKSDYSYRIFKLLNNYATKLNHSGIIFKDIKADGEVIISAQEIKSIYYKFNTSYNISQRMNGTKEKLYQIFQAKIASNKKILEKIDLYLESISSSDLSDLKQEKEFDTDDGEIKFLRKKLIKRISKRPLALINSGSFIKFNTIFSDFISWMDKNEKLKKEDLKKDHQILIEHLKSKKLSMDEATAYIYLSDILQGRKGNKDIRFVLVDEAQDYSDLQLNFLRFAYPKAKFTLASDFNQSIIASSSLVNSNVMKTQFKEKIDVDFINIKNTYRSTIQISELSDEVIGETEDINHFNREGKKPYFYLEKNKDKEFERINNIINNSSNKKISIVTKNMKQAREVFDYLNSQRDDVELIDKEEKSIFSNIIVIPIFFAKGLEFDEVIIPFANESNFNSDLDRNVLYTMITRAMHTLSLTSAIDITKFLKNNKNDLLDIKIGK